MKNNTKKLFLVARLSNQVPEVSVEEVADSIENVQLLSCVITVALLELSIGHCFSEFKVEYRRLTFGFVENHVKVVEAIVQQYLIFLNRRVDNVLQLTIR